MTELLLILDTLYPPPSTTYKIHNMSDDYSEFPILPKAEVEMIADNTNRATHRIRTFTQKYVPGLAKNNAKFDTMYNDLIVEPMKNTSSSQSSMETDDGQPESENRKCVDPELSIHAQYLLSESINILKKILADMSQEHKHPIHHLISRCGKSIDNRFYSELSKLLKNEKEIENDPDNLAHANRLILEHLMGLGRTEVAETFLKESEMMLKLPDINNVDILKEVMDSFRRCDYLPAIQWVMECAPHHRDLLFHLQCQHIIRLLETRDKLEALRYVKQLQSFPLDKYKQELANLMFVVISYPQKGPYNYLFHPGRWFALEEELAHALTDYRSSLSTILTTGAKTVPSLMTMRAFLSSARPGNLPILPDELPCNVPIPMQVHSSFCCPILKVQSTENNPPVRLCCGHVISTDAMNKLAQQSRNNRLKCPYCPLESVLQETKVLHF